MSFEIALGALRAIPQFFLWRLEWDGVQAKYLKTPCALDGSVYRMDASQPANWNTYETAAFHQATLNTASQCADRTLQYALGFWLTVDCGYWFLDLDKCGADGELLPFAAQMVDAFPGAMVEWSSSKRGVHVFGRCVNGVPPHRMKPPREIAQKLLPIQMEFYTQDRGVAFGLDGVAQGNADTVHDTMIAGLVERYFPPRAEADSAVRTEWRGPADDDELIRRALNARQSAESAFGGKASFAQLWTGEGIEKNSEHDMALASHLAFWTGCDEDRIARLMRKSGMVRDKWNDRRPHGTYLSFTIANACAGCSSVYQEPAKSDAAMVAMLGTSAPIEGQLASTSYAVITPELSRKVDEMRDEISKCGTFDDMYNIVIPLIRNANIPAVYAEQLARQINQKLDTCWSGKLPIAKLRAMICPPALMTTKDPPLWVQKHCYVKDGDYFMDMETGATMTYVGFIAEYGKLMPIKENGSRENAAEWALHRWNMATVQKVGYRPDKGPFYTYDGLEYANLYNANSVPIAMPLTQAGIDGITAFQSHLFDMCGRRLDVFNNLVWWLAHNVQRPGIKIRWSPVIKGTHGDGKTLLMNVVRAAMGHRNVSITGNSTLTNSGGFNDWAVGAAVNVIEEIMLTGRDRHRLYNAMQEFISNDIVSINPKGAKGYVAHNTVNHVAYTNHNNAIPLAREDRRWLVIFTPWASLADMQRYCGLTPETWADRTAAMDLAWREHAGEVRTWFLSIQIGPSFDIRGSAPMTPEKRRMTATSQDDVEAVAAQIIADGAHGVTENVFSSSCLNLMLKVRATQDNFELPKTTALNQMLTRMGFSRYEKLVKWKGGMHTIWTKDGFVADNDAIRKELDRSCAQTSPTQPID